MPIIAGPRALMETLVASIGIPAAVLIPTSGAFIGKKICRAKFQPKLKNVFVALDGEAATSDDLFLAVGDIMTLDGYHNLAQLRIIEEAASAKLLIIPFYMV